MKYSLYGIIGIIADLIILTSLDVSIKFQLIILATDLLLFILGMGDLAQVRDINVYGGLKKNFKETIYLPIDIFLNIFRTIFFTSYKNKFIKVLSYNLKNIKRGFVRAILIIRKKESRALN